jgi:outer membrane protein assembly factor BamA
MLIGYAGNILETPIDAYFIGFSGEAEGYYAMANDLYLWPKLLYLNIDQMAISKYGVNMYSKRGMDTKKDDYSIYVGNKFLRQHGRATLSLFDKRWELWTEKVTYEGRTNEIRSSEGDLIFEYDDPIEFDGERTSMGTQLDFTDDKTDPRSGLRFKAIQDHHPADDDDSPEYDVLTWSVTLYLPILKDSTWAFHYSRSDATVSQEGLTDVETLKAEKGFALCQFKADPASCEAAILSDVENTIKANKNGTSLSLGGTDRLRSYPSERFSGAHTLFYGTEFRWNLNTEATGINLYFLKDILQALQMAFFWEQGSVSETEAELGEIVRSSYGFGVRLVAKSGNAYRLDWATGEEGPQYTILFQYPWGESE